VADDPTAVAAGQPTETPDEQTPGSASKGESEGSWFNRAIRGVAGALRGTSFSLDEPEDAAPEAVEETPAEQPTTITEAEAAERERRAAQSERDRVEAQRRWDEAIEAADREDPRLLTQLAEQGNARAERELERRGLTYELGQVRGTHLRQADHTEAQDGLIRTVAGAFDAAVLDPLLSALPKDEMQKIVGDGLTGMEGRKAAAEAAVTAIRRRAVTDAMGDERIARQLLGPDSAFRKALLANPTTNKTLRALFRGELDEPELNRGLEAGWGGERESDVMNNAIRRAASSSLDRAPAERAAGAGRGRRYQNRDALEDDE